MRRESGVLVPLEVSILETAIELRGRGEDELHGFVIAKEIKGREEARLLPACGELYRAPGRMEASGLFESHWEDARIAAEENRPRWHLYRASGIGERTLSVVETMRRAQSATLRERLTPRERFGDYVCEQPHLKLDFPLHAGVSPYVQTRRRAEVGCDLWEQTDEDRETNRRTFETAPEILPSLYSGCPPISPGGSNIDARGARKSGLSKGVESCPKQCRRTRCPSSRMSLVDSFSRPR